MRKKITSFPILVLLLALITLPLTLFLLRQQTYYRGKASDGEKVIFKGDFERGNLTGFFWNQNKPEVVEAPHPVRAGRYSMKSYLHRYDSKYSYRTMVQAGSKDTNPEGFRENLSLDINKEYWLGFSIFVPSDFTPDGDGCDELWFQIQAVPDPDELWRSPVLAIYVSENNYSIVNRWDTKPQSSGMSWTGTTSLANPSVVPDRGKWVDWVFHVKWSWQDGGLVEVWKDGNLIGTRHGPNCSNDREGPRISFGVYKWPWKLDGPGASACLSSVVERLIYIDEFRVGNASAGYNDVSPSDSSPLISLTPTQAPSQPTNTPTPSSTPTPTTPHLGGPEAILTPTPISTSTPIPTTTPTSTPINQQEELIPFSIPILTIPPTPIPTGKIVITPTPKEALPEAKNLKSTPLSFLGALILIIIFSLGFLYLR